MRKFCRVVIKHLQPIFVQTPNESQFMILTTRFEQLHCISYTIRAINRSHIIILALVANKEDYYCRKSYHSTILWGIVELDCLF